MDKLKLVHTAAAYYGPAVLKNVNFIDSISIQDEQNREITIEWIFLGSKIAPKLRVFDDAWGFLFSCPELMEIFATLENKNPTAQQVKERLIEAGANDRTPYTQ